MSFRHHTILLAAAVVLLSGSVFAQTDLDQRVEHGYANNNGVKIHYASLGKGPLIVMIHGFPDFWYTWRDQMEALSATHQVVAIDQRGYNLSDKPAGVEFNGLKLVGVINGRHRLALVEAAGGLGYILKPGDSLGNGHVTDISPDSVTFAVGGEPSRRETSVTLRLAGN